jgi:hypothetical protein
MVQKTEPREITEIINVVFMKFWTLWTLIVTTLCTRDGEPEYGTEIIVCKPNKSH